MLDPEFLKTPIAHRAFHDVANGRPENSRAAIRAAMAHGYGIEIDVQRSADGRAMVFHDYTLDRLTGETGPIGTRSSGALAAIALTGGGEGIPSLAEVLDLVGGKVPLLIEIKDQDGAMGGNVGPLEDAVAGDLSGYGGPVAVMSFNPHSVAAMGERAPDVARGLTTSAFQAEHWPLLPAERRARLARIEDLDRTGACFISHDARDLASPRVRAIKAGGLPVLCWTIRSPEEEAQARRYADNVTFEKYQARAPA